MLYIQNKVALIVLAIACLMLAGCVGLTPEVKELIIQEVAKVVQSSLSQVEGITPEMAKGIADAITAGLEKKLALPATFDWTPIISSVLTTGAGLLGLNTYRNRTRARALQGETNA